MIPRLVDLWPSYSWIGMCNNQACRNVDFVRGDDSTRNLGIGCPDCGVELIAVDNWMVKKMAAAISENA